MALHIAAATLRHSAAGQAGSSQRQQAAAAAAHHQAVLRLLLFQITYLPLEGMAQCTQLRTLLLSRAGLQHWPLPPPPGSLPQLRELDLSGNRGLALIPPGGLAACPGLVSLNLSGEAAACLSRLLVWMLPSQPTSMSR